ncbi:ABC transporter permease [uncultured Fibrella sp.]|uniref:ABC transporter permease n=1 Tax=uncultured Fibrella sp. TaxID=1284596 RepID=UPI0035C9CD0E
MLTNYIKIAWRSLNNQRGFTFINIVGLALGIACCLLISLYVLDELSYDRFNEKADRIYRVNSDIKFGGNDMHYAVAPDPMGPTLKANYPQVEAYTRLHYRGNWLVKRAGSTANTRENDIIFADSTLFDVFTLPLVAGADPGKALAIPNSVVISESAARRYFGAGNAVGQTLIFNNKDAYTVTAVMRDMPTNSHFRTDFFLAMRNDDYPWGQWFSVNHHTYIVLKPGTDATAFARNFDQVIETYAGPQIHQILGSSLDQFRKAGNSLRFWLLPLTDIHLRSKQTIELAPNGDIQYVYIFSAVALFILLIACINFMNLATARSAKRAKEVGVRKVLGSERSQLIGQFMAESILTAVLALLLALTLVALIMPLFNSITAKALTINSLLTPSRLFAILLLPVGVGLLAGSYPALFLSSFRPISVLKGAVISRGTGLKAVSLRSGLVVFQFMMSVLLIVGTLVVYRQLHFIQTTKVGFDRERVLTIQDVYGLGKQAEAFKQDVLRLPGVTTGTLSSYLPTPSNRDDTSFFPEGKTDLSKGMSMQIWGVDYDYMATLGMSLTKGRNFSRSFGTDSTGIILNEAAVKILGVKNPIGMHISRFNDSENKTRKTYTVIGVIKNFHFESLRRNIGALSLVLSPQSGAVSFRISQANVPALLRQIEAKWKQFAPGQPFNYSFLQDSFDQMYRAEQRVGTVILLFSVLAILIACLGLFGLAAFMAEQRTKEIGVRKVLGASTHSIVGLLSKDFLKLVLIAIVIASPLAWYAMTSWLADFAYKVDIEWWVFALAGALAVGIALLTISFQSVKAALMNPVTSLRSE